MTTNEWQETKLKLAIAGALVFGALSILFSMLGLQFTSENGWAWIVGLLMAFGITVIQLVGNSVKRDTIFTVIWITSYAYGISANILGIVGLMGNVSPIMMYLIAVPMGILIEIVPEKLLLISMSSLGDAIRGIIPTVSTNKKATKYTPKHRPAWVNKPTSSYNPAMFSRADYTPPDTTPKPFIED